jgi:hypothetical protein
MHGLGNQRSGWSGYVEMWGHATADIHLWDKGTRCRGQQIDVYLGRDLHWR